MARADLLKRIFESYQRRDDAEFRSAAAEIVDAERRKHHSVLANELQRILSNGVRSLERVQGLEPRFGPVPTDGDRKTPLLAVREPDRYFRDLIYDPPTRAVLDRTVEEIRDWEVLEANGLRPACRLLFCGPSGCGKTASAEAIAAELGLPMLYVRFDSVVSSLLGETAANVRKVFDYASRGEWVLFFDEFDAIGRSRDDATEHGEIKRVVNSFLQLLDGFSGRSLVIAATNFSQALDPAIWRRFDEVLHFRLPDEDAMDALVKRCLRVVRASRRQVQDVVEAVAGSSFAEAERVCLDARKRCALAGKRRLGEAELAKALERFRYRRRVFESSVRSASAPAVDRE